MTKIEVSERSDDLAGYDIGYYKGANYVQTDSAWVDRQPLKFNGKLIRPGDKFTKLGTRARRSFEMEDGHYLRYEGRLGDLALFSADGDTSDGWYYAFYVVDGNGGRLLVIGPDGAADIW